MPYRAMFVTIVTVALALLGITLWALTISPLLAESQRIAATQAGAQQAAGLALMFRGVLILALLLVSLLILLGFAATLHEWMRRTPASRRRVRTRYVDIWKLAGERMKVPDEGQNPSDQEKNPDGGDSDTR